MHTGSAFNEEQSCFMNPKLLFPCRNITGVNIDFVFVQIFFQNLIIL